MQGNGLLARYLILSWDATNLKSSVELPEWYGLTLAVRPRLREMLAVFSA